MTLPDAPTELFTLEESREKVRLTGPRLSDIGTVPSAHEPSADRVEGGRFGPRNKVAAGRRAKMALTRDVRNARRRCEDAIKRAVDPSEADRVIGDAWAIWSETKRDVGHRSIVVVSNALTFAIETVLAGYFANAAAAGGNSAECGGAP